MSNWATATAGGVQRDPLDVVIEVPALDEAQRAVLTGQADPPTTQLSALQLQRANAMALADTVPVARTRAPEASAVADTHAIAIVGTAPGPSLPEENAPAPRFSFDVRKVIWAVAVVVMAAVLVTAAIVGFQYQAGKQSPRARAMEYAGLVVKGDIEQAGKLAGHPGATGPLLTNAAYKGALNRPVSARLGEAKTEGSTAQVTVTYILADGGELTQGYHFVKNGKALLVIDKWAFEPFELGAIDISSQIDGNTIIAGMPVQLSAPGTQTSFAAYPGSYPVEFTDEGGTYAQVKELAVVGNEATAVEVQPQPTTEGRAAVTQKATEHIRAIVDACAASKLADAGCGAPLNTVGKAYQGQAVTMKVATYPKVEVRFVSGKWEYAALGGRIDVNGAGGAGQQQVFNSVGTLDVAPDGAVTVTPSQLPNGSGTQAGGGTAGGGSGAGGSERGPDRGGQDGAATQVRAIPGTVAPA